MSEANAYVPGVCNINPKEIAQRRLIGHIGAGVFVALLAFFLLTDVTRLIRIILFLPAVLSASGYLQAKNHFCVGYAGAGQENATPGNTKANDITEQSALSADKKRARQMNLQSIGIGLVATIISLAIPHI